MSRPADPTVPPLTLLTLDEAADRLRISRWLLYRLINSGRLQPVEFGRRRLISPAALDRLVAEAERGRP